MENKRSLKSLALTGSLWTLGGYGTGQILRLGSHLILAWLLTPQIFGLMALVKVVQQGLNMFSDVGIKPAIIQNKRGDDPEFLNTAWSIQILRGISLWICACILAWPFAALFARNDPAAWQLVSLLPVTGFVAVFEGFNSTALATLNRNLHLGRMTILELSTQIVSLTVMVIWALIQPSVWAMVAGGLAAAAFRMILSHFIVRGHKVRLGWNRQCVGELFKFGKWIFLSTVLTFLALNLDKLILGNLLTLDDLGLYSIAFVFAKVALYVCTRLGVTVLFPVYSKYREDPKRMLSVALKAREVVLWVGAAVSISFGIGSTLFFETFWDPRYHQAGAIAQWMALYIWSMIVLLTIDGIPLALGNSKALFVSNVWRCAGIILAVGGYWYAELPGFIVGLSLGPLMAQVYLLRHIPVDRTIVVAQGVWFTLGALIYGVPAMAITTWIRATADEQTLVAAIVMLASVPLIVSAIVVMKRIRGKMDDLKAT